MRWIGNAFSLGMLASSERLDVKLVSLEEAIEWLRAGVVTSCIGHADTALLLNGLTGINLSVNRCSTALEKGDELLVAQYNGPRLPEGATSLPDGATIRWFLVKVETGESKT